MPPSSVTVSAEAPHRPLSLWRWVRRVVGTSLLLFLLALAYVMIDIWSAFGTRATGERLARMQQSPQYVDGRFVNTLPEQNATPSWETMKRWFFGDNTYREPSEPLPVVRRTAADFSVAPEDLRITWIGHSTLLIEIDGLRILTDPVWSDHAAPSPLFGVKRFYAPPLSLDDLPPLDAVVLSHDHYDHLDEQTIRALATRVPRFIAPLGVGAHLEYWGVAPDRILEQDWWDTVELTTPAGTSVTVACTPARHFSGRFITDRAATLWAGWAFLGAEKRVFYSGDTAMFPGFAEIGDRLGPFDVTLMEVGAYNPDWTDVHMGPEQAVEAHQRVRGGVMVPVHWGTFNLAFHSWTEPAERVRAATEALGIPVAYPRPGESLTLMDPPSTPWWPSIPWKTATEVPIRSSGLSNP